jgi:hypothetical protein
MSLGGSAHRGRFRFRATRWRTGPSSPHARHPAHAAPPDGHPKTADDIREPQLAAFDPIDVIADDMREIVEAYMADLLRRPP